MSTFLKRKEISVKRMAQKYIVNDIVMYKNRIHTIIDILASNGYELSYIRHQVNRVELSGVPLTPEILEKNGWEFDSATWIYKKGYIKVFKLLDDKTYAAYIFDVRVFEFHFIHELQHLLFGLNINHEMEV